MVWTHSRRAQRCRDPAEKNLGASSPGRVRGVDKFAGAYVDETATAWPLHHRPAKVGSRIGPQNPKGEREREIVAARHDAVDGRGIAMLKREGDADGGRKQDDADSDFRERLSHGSMIVPHDRVHAEDFDAHGSVLRTIDRHPWR
jgi:hypothetical protein